MSGVVSARGAIWSDDELFGDTVPTKNPSGPGTFTCNLRFPGQ